MGSSVTVIPWFARLVPTINFRIARESSELRETLSNGVGATVGAPASFGRAAMSS